MRIVIEEINPQKIHQELIANGVRPKYVEHNAKDDKYIADKAWITFDDDVDMEIAQQTIDEHDPTPLPSRPTAAELLEQRINELELYILTQEGLI